MKKHIAGELVMIELSKLTLHPAHERFAPLDDAKYEFMKASMEARGQKDPIEATDKLVVIDGRDQVRAAKELGWPDILALVRDDLTNEQAVLRALLAANTIRRQQPLLEQVEVLIELQAEGNTLDISAITGASKKQVGRLRAIVEGPPELLAAVKEPTSGVSERLANQVLKLPSKLLAECVRVLNAGVDVDKKLRKLVAARTALKAKQAEPNQLVQSIVAMVAALPEPAEVAAGIESNQRPALQSAVELLSAVLNAIPESKKKPVLRLLSGPNIASKPK